MLLYHSFSNFWKIGNIRLDIVFTFSYLNVPDFILFLYYDIICKMMFNSPQNRSQLLGYFENFIRSQCKRMNTHLKLFKHGFKFAHHISLTWKSMVRALTHCTMLLDINFEKKMLIELYLILLIFSIGNTSQSESVPYHLNGLVTT